MVCDLVDRKGKGEPRPSMASDVNALKIRSVECRTHFLVVRVVDYLPGTNRIILVLTG